MRLLFILIEKEFKQIFRNKAVLPLIFVLPIVQLLLLPLAADYEIKNINLAVVDNDHSEMSRDLGRGILASGYFKLTAMAKSQAEAMRLIEEDKADLILTIPSRFERSIVKNKQADLLVQVNAINGVKGGLAASYLGQIITNFNTDIRLELLGGTTSQSISPIEIVPNKWFNPNLNYRFFMVPGILAILVTMIAGYLSALNIVKEKEVGTIEQINVTPISKWQFILGKLIPFWVLGIVIFTIGLFVVSRGVYGIIPVGSILLLYLFLIVYLPVVLGFGLLISTYSNTQQQAMSVAFFFIMIFMLMSGLFTPIESMPEWAKMIAAASPVTYFIEVMRMVVLKGSTFSDIKYHLLIIVGFAIGLNAWAVFNYKKRS